MSASSHNLNQIWAEHLVEELVRNGVTCFCMSPGARCGPLTATLAARTDIELVVHPDERASAFYALGYGRAQRRPAVWITTSGSAVANGFPAVVEAAMDHVPLILLTADRPPELRDCGSNQTIHQPHIFGGYTRWFCDMPAPDIRIPLAYVLTTADQAVYQSSQHPAGPVHLNAMYRDPLARAPDGNEYGAYLSTVKTWRNTSAPYVRYGSGTVVPDEDTASRLVDSLNSSRTGLIFVGRLAGEADRAAVQTFIQKTGWPTLVDIGSGLRLGTGADSIIPYSDQILLNAEWMQEHAPKVLLHIGGPCVSKRVSTFEGRYEGDYIQIQTHPNRQNPTHRGGLFVQADLATYLPALAEKMKRAASPAYLKVWKSAQSCVAGVVQKYVESHGEITEIALASDLSRLVPEAHALYVASSMPVRDMDMYGDAAGTLVPVGANRGASGIDGTLSTAAGYAHGLQKPVTVVTGDLAAFHDLTGWLYLKQAKQPLTVIIVNNDGGGIFSFLPFAEDKSVFETAFGTPHGMTFQHAAAQFGLHYQCPNSRTEFKQAYQFALSCNASTIIEVRTERNANVEQHRKLQEEIRSAFMPGRISVSAQVGSQITSLQSEDTSKVEGGAPRRRSQG